MFGRGFGPFSVVRWSEQRLRTLVQGQVRTVASPWKTDGRTSVQSRMGKHYAYDFDCSRRVCCAKNAARRTESWNWWISGIWVGREEGAACHVSSTEEGVAQPSERLEAI